MEQNQKKTEMDSKLIILFVVLLLLFTATLIVAHRSSRGNRKIVIPSPPISGTLTMQTVSTAPHIAARMIFTAATTYEDIESCHVGDFGVGPGVLSLGAQAMGAAYVCGFDCDQEALDLASINFASLDVHGIDLVQVDVQSLSLTSDFDTVLMNPPFGTRNSGVDTAFVHKAMKHANAVYSLHKTSTRDHFVRLAGTPTLSERSFT